MLSMHIKNHFYFLYILNSCNMEQTSLKMMFFFMLFVSISSIFFCLYYNSLVSKCCLFFTNELNMLCKYANSSVSADIVVGVSSWCDADDNCHIYCRVVMPANNIVLKIFSISVKFI